MLAGSVADQEELLTLQKQLAVYQGLLTAAINRHDTANVIAGLTKQRDDIKQQINVVSYRLKVADEPSHFMTDLAKTGEGLTGALKFGGALVLPLALIAAIFYFRGKK